MAKKKLKKTKLLNLTYTKEKPITPEATEQRGSLLMKNSFFKNQFREEFAFSRSQQRRNLPP
jgi:hypothetical protein